ncbi:hypothetical protein D9619_011531 [Psilocybe cf. subviscida]|uniref:Uncharacterized protein n=1 Tax=Psilocybe cf. subviscida TaxID=2480587 RepID=A0A8H5BSW3_9AGAR|nr:hypothetical protein D9619_011531 [Psilocybe cf. subviscida]
MAALQRLACVRCEFWPPRASTNACGTPIPRQLPSISISPRTRTVKTSWWRPPNWKRGIQDPATRLCELAATLRAAMPAWYTPHNRKLSKETLKKLENALKAIEATNVTNVNDLLPSSIHLALGDLTRMYQREDPDNRYPHLANRAKEMLAKWMPLFKISLQEFS